MGTGAAIDLFDGLAIDTGHLEDRGGARSLDRTASHDGKLRAELPDHDGDYTPDSGEPRSGVG